METAIIIIAVVSLLILGFITYQLIKLLKELAKIIKSDNLQEYEMTEWKPENEQMVNVWQEDKRYSEVSSVSDELLNNIEINPDKIYKWVFGWNTKTETFN